MSGCIQPNETNEVIIGAILPLSGNLSYSGQAAQVGLDVAAEDVNTYLANKGVKVRLVIEDDENNPVVALAKIKKLKEMGARFVIGPDASAGVEAVKPYADENGIILISHASTAPSLSIPYDNVFRLLPDDTHQAEAVANLMLDDGVKAIVPMWRGDVWGDDLYEATKIRFEGLGGIVLDGVRYSPQTDFSNELVLLSM
ncbi:MAG: penicillin-binding protein activator [Candidatus Methanoperedens sp.]